MDVIEGLTTLAERVAPALAIPVGSAVVVTILWLLTGWGWFDLGPWPWALGAIPVVGLALGRLWLVARRRQLASQAVSDVAASLVALAHSLRALGASDAPARAAVRLARARWGREGAGELSGILDEAEREKVRAAADPLAAALGLVGPSAVLDEVWRSIARCESLRASPDVDVPSSALTTLFLATLPVGLVTTTGWWTFAAIAGVSLAFLSIEAIADDLARPLGAARGSVPVDAVLDAAERALPPQDH